MIHQTIDEREAKGALDGGVGEEQARDRDEGATLSSPEDCWTPRVLEGRSGVIRRRSCLRRTPERVVSSEHFAFSPIARRATTDSDMARLTEAFDRGLHLDVDTRSQDVDDRTRLGSVGGRVRSTSDPGGQKRQSPISARSNALRLDQRLLTSRRSRPPTEAGRS